MKKYLEYVIIFLNLMFVVPTFAQVELGIIASLNSTSLDGRYKDVSNINTVSRGSLGLGALFIFNFNENIALQVEPAYCEKGGMNGKSGVDFGEISFGYFEVPILVKYSLDTPYFLAGIYQAFITNAYYIYKVEQGGSNLIKDQNLGIKDELSNSDTGFCIGVGANVPTGKGKVIFQAQYTRGFRNIFKLDESNGSLKNQGIHLKIGILFSL